MTTQQSVNGNVRDDLDSWHEQNLEKRIEQKDKENENLRLLIDKLRIDNAILRRDKRIIEKELKTVTDASGIIRLRQLIRLLRQR